MEPKGQRRLQKKKIKRKQSLPYLMVPTIGLEPTTY